MTFSISARYLMVLYAILIARIVYCCDRLAFERHSSATTKVRVSRTEQEVYMWRQKEREGRGTEQAGWVHEADRPADGGRSHSRIVPDDEHLGSEKSSPSGTVPIRYKNISETVHHPGNVLQDAGGLRVPGVFVLCNVRHVGELEAHIVQRRKLHTCSFISDVETLPGWNGERTRSFPLRGVSRTAI